MDIKSYLKGFFTRAIDSVKESKEAIEYLVSSENNQEFIEELDKIAASLPVISSLVKIKLTMDTFSEIAKLAKINSFFTSLEENNISHQEREKYYKENLETEENLTKELCMLSIYLNNLDNEEKTKILGNLYANLVKGKIHLNHFKELCGVLSNFNIIDIPQLKQLYETPNGEIKTNQELEHPASAYRLAALGLLIYSGIPFPSQDRNDTLVARLLATGESFYKNGFLSNL